MLENWVNIRLDKIDKKVSAIYEALFSVSKGLEFFIEEENEEFLDTVIYGQEAIEGICEILMDVKNDLLTLSSQVEERREEEKSDNRNDNNFEIPDKI